MLLVLGDLALSISSGVLKGIIFHIKDEFSSNILRILKHKLKRSVGIYCDQVEGRTTTRTILLEHTAKHRLLRTQLKLLNMSQEEYVCMIRYV